jgi:O-acetyl-ADP-ribose deacetylase (regulator of RNase III)
MLGLRQFRGVQIDLFQGDITTFVCDGMGNAANAELAGGGGVDGAIHKAAGPEIMTELRTKFPDGCPTGQAVVTTAGHLPAQYILHAVGPKWTGTDTDQAQLASAYGQCLKLAESLGLRHLALPSISTGVYGFPLAEAAPIAMSTVKEFITSSNPQSLRRVTFVLFNKEHHDCFQDNLFKIFPEKV